MDINTIIKSTEYLEFINSVDFLYWELLYSKNNGFISLTSKDAINQAKNVLISFDSETDKIAKKVNFEDKNEIIQNKRQDLISKINEHCYDQSLIWANEVYNDAIKNILLSVSIDKKNVNECYQKGLSAINWVCSVKKSNEKTKNILIDEFKKDIEHSINSSPDDYIPKTSVKDSDLNVFFKLFDLILDNEKPLCEKDILKNSSKLNKEDLAYFVNIIREFQIYKKTSLKDEISLINAAFEVMKLKDNKEKYDFIKDIKNDFYEFEHNNKKIEVQDKIDLTKRRINMFSSNPKKALNYYKKVLTSSNE